MKKLDFLTLLLMISFASVNAVLFTPALPAIAHFFSISDSAAQLTITWFLVGYALGQLLYSPFANRFGRKPALYGGIFLQILSSLLCVFAGAIHQYSILVLGRFLLALGSGVGLKMTFTLVNESYEPKKASQLLSYLMIAFAITPGLGVMLGSLLSTHLGWQSTFYASAIYGVILWLLTMHLTETKTELNVNALKLNHLFSGYLSQFKNLRLIVGGLLMGSATCFVYVFAAIAPFIAINIMHMNVAVYGVANLIPALGLIAGSLFSAQLAKRYSQHLIVSVGVYMTLIASGLMLLFVLLNLSAIVSLFIPMMLCYFGLSLVFANASTMAMSHVSDKAHGSAVMNFINMGFVAGVVLTLGEWQIKTLLLPSIFIGICFFMLILHSLLTKFLSENKSCKIT